MGITGIYKSRITILLSDLTKISYFASIFSILYPILPKDSLKHSIKENYILIFRIYDFYKNEKTINYKSDQLWRLPINTII